MFTRTTSEPVQQKKFQSPLQMPFLTNIISLANIEEQLSNQIQPLCCEFPESPRNLEDFSDISSSYNMPSFHSNPVKYLKSDTNSNTCLSTDCLQRYRKTKLSQAKHYPCCNCRSEEYPSEKRQKLSDDTSDDLEGTIETQEQSLEKTVEEI